MANDKALLQKAVDAVQKAANQACKRREGEWVPLTYSETHLLRAAATAWSEHVAKQHKLKLEGEDAGPVLSAIEQIDTQLETARYICDPH